MNAMQKSKIAKGVGVGIAIAGTAGLIGSAVMKPGYKRSTKKSVNKALKTFSNVLDALQ